MIRDFRLDRGLGVLSVVAGSPAAQAGLIAGDVILSVNGEPLRLERSQAPARATTRRSALEASEWPAR